MAKNWTDEERKAFGDKMRAARAKKLALVEIVPAPSITIVGDGPQMAIGTEPTKLYEEGDIQTSVDDIPVQDISPTSQADILTKAIEAIAMLAEIQKNGLQAGPQGQGAAINGGKILGTVQKYATDPALYPSPLERLAAEPQLVRFGFKENYELNWLVEVSSYETIDHVRTSEPRFSIDLIRVLWDEETGEKTNGRIKMYRAVFHEDPDTALKVAQDNGIDVNAFGEQEFLNEMRYLQIRDWLLECFMPKKPQDKNNLREMVIDGKLVQYFEINGESAPNANLASLPKAKL